MPGHLIRRCQQIAVALFVEETQRFDLTPVQYAALVSVRENPGIDQVGLVGRIALDRSSAAQVVERLEHKRWLRRQADRKDRRKNQLYLTPAGEALLKKVEPAVHRAQERMLAPLAADEAEQFMSMLERIVDFNNEQSRAPLRRAPTALDTTTHKPIDSAGQAHSP
jgi:DNA-binding MarR family transcriptional regulator